MYRACLYLGAMGPDKSDALLCEMNEGIVTGLALANFAILKRYNLPSIYDVAPQYHFPKGEEQWKDIDSLLRVRSGDCKDLVAWRLAELWKQGRTDAAPKSTIDRGRNPQDILFHVFIVFGDGTTEDPSRLLGMK